MQPKQWSTIDKAAWGAGAWQNEPDKMQWMDEATGLPCLLVRHTALGHLCGYVGVLPTHPAHGLAYDGTLDFEFRKHMEELRAKLSASAKYMKLGSEGATIALEKFMIGTPDRAAPGVVGDLVAAISVHGGLTFAGACQEGDDPSCGVCHVPDVGEPDGVWWFGFDMGHAFDMSPEMRALVPSHPIFGDERYRDVPYVQGECADLAKQLAAITVDAGAPPGAQATTTPQTAGAGSPEPATADS